MAEVIRSIVYGAKSAARAEKKGTLQLGDMKFEDNKLYRWNVEESKWDLIRESGEMD